MDIVIIKQSDDTYKSSPVRVRFGSFRVLKAKEKLVNVLINGQKTDLMMRLSDNGEAYFLTEIQKAPHNDKALSDGYASPVDVGISAPSSPVIKPVPNEMTISSISMMAYEEKSKLQLQLQLPLSFQAKDMNGEKAGEVTETNQCKTKDRKYSFSHKVEMQKITLLPRRKSSFDIMTIGFHVNKKLKITRQCEFSLLSTISSSKFPGCRKNDMRIELSDSWSSISKNKDELKSNLEDLFYKNKISKEDFFKDPWRVLNSTNLAIKHESHVYTWKVIAPLIVSMLAYDEELPPEVIKTLTQQQLGFFLWRKVDLHAFKIDIKKNSSSLLQPPLVPSVSIPTPVILSATTLKEVVTPLKKDPLDTLIEKKPPPQYKKSYTLSNDQIKSLGLKEGKNTISFVVSSRYQGTHVLNSDVYLWNYDDKIVVSDLDGTITRSDVLGQFFPFFGKDWSHTNVVKLFNDIAANGYKIMYLTARAICQCDQTRNYLTQLTQNKITLPIGPILMSPDGLVSSFKREVIDRTPHNLKIECLTQILNLFPEDTRPFYAGIGNKKTDAIAYESIGISKGKIFIINEKGEISQSNSCYKSSYTQMDQTINEMFPFVKGNNTYFCSLNYFKPHLKEMNIKDLFA